MKTHRVITYSLVFLSLWMPPVFAQEKTSTFFADLLLTNHIGYYDAFSKEQKKAWRYTPIGDMKLGYKGSQPNVRGEATLQVLFTNEGAKLDVYRAFVKVNFTHLRLTLGKSTFTWGEGVYFNAGDLLFLDPTKSTQVTTNDNKLRDNSRWLSTLHVPISTYSMYEASVIAPEFPLFQTNPPPNTKPGMPVQPIPPPRVTDTSIGNRFLFKIIDVQSQVGYLFTGKGMFHQPYYSLQGSVLNYFDIYFTNSFTIAQDKSEDFEPLLDLGFYYPLKIADNQLIAFRLENQFIPTADWQDKEDVHARYGYQMFFDTTYTIDQWSIILRNILSPIDTSDQLVFLVNWNVYQGLSLFGSFQTLMGDKDDYFSWRRSESFAINLGARYIY